MIIRNDITGLRGVAITLILIYHYNKNYLLGGFAGVDIFLTVSGYFITKSIIERYNEDKFSYTNYYTNRIKKLLPSCFSMWIFLLIIFNINIEINLIKDILYSMCGIINYRFYKITIDYLSLEEKPSLLLHFWTLSLQQQFYAFWPIVLIVYNIQTVFIVITFTFASFLICNYYSKYDVSFSYFSLSSRFWEIGVGSLFYLYSNSNTYSSNTFSYISVAILLIFSILFNSEIYSYPNYITLIPVISSCIIIIKGNNSNKLLTNCFTLYIGKISYSLYIIHYPFIHLCNDWKFIEIISLIFALSVLSYIKVEYSYTNTVVSSTNIEYLLFLFLLLFVVLILLMSKKFKKKLPFNNSNNYGRNIFTKITQSFLDCPLNTITPKFYNAHKFVLLGDCHLQQWLPIINKIAFSYGYLVFHIYYWAVYIEKGIYKDICSILKSIGNIKLIFLSQYLSYKPYMENYNLLKKKYIEYLNVLYSQNYTKNIFVIQDTGFNNKSVQECFKYKKGLCYGYLGKNFTKYAIPIIPEIKILDFNNYICKKNICPFIIDNIIVYMDRHHLNPHFVLHLEQMFYKNISSILMKQPKSLYLKNRNYYKNTICCNNRWKYRKCFIKGD